MASSKDGKAARLLQRIQLKKKDDSRQGVTKEPLIEEPIEMSPKELAVSEETTEIADSNVSFNEKPVPQPRRSILQSKNKSSHAGSVNLSFQPDIGYSEKDKSEALDNNVEPAENVKDNGQEHPEESKERPEVPPLVLPSNSKVEPVRPAVRQDEGLVLGITVHQTDPLETDYHIRHPMVRIHIIDQNVGGYLAKLDRNRPVSSFYENQHTRSDFVLPILTQPYSFSQHRSLVPKWEETVVFNENFYYFTDPSVSTFVVFELLDYIAVPDVAENVRHWGREGGWIKIAWAFLKLVGKGGQNNTSRRCRLQLYRIPPYHHHQGQQTASQCEASAWLKTTPRAKYPSTLYVSVKALQLPAQLLPSSRSMVATQGEVGLARDDNDDFAMKLGLLTTAATGTHLLQSTSAVNGAGAQLQCQQHQHISRWSRLPGQVCRLPNKQLASVFIGRMGATRLSFSHSGLFLAAAGVDPPSCDFPVALLGVTQQLGVVHSCYGHINIVYDLCWAPDDSRLVSASSDATARVWNVEAVTCPAGTSSNSPRGDQNTQDLQQQHLVLAHPSFVYAARFHPKVPTLVATGCYDGSMRIWSLGRACSAVQLQEVPIGAGAVNSLVFEPAGHLVYSGTDQGCLMAWTCHVSAQPGLAQAGMTRPWHLDRRLEASELAGVPINRLVRLANSSKLLVHSRDSALRMFDLSSQVCTQLYTGHVNAREFVGSCVTPCGTFVMAASEVGTCFVWNAVTGDVVTIYDQLSFSSAVSDVAFHPHDHIVAFACYGSSQPVHVYCFDEAKARLEAEYLKRVERGEAVAGSDRNSKLLEPDNKLDMDKEISAINDHIARNFAARVDKVNKALSAVAPMPPGSFKQNVVDSLLFGAPTPRTATAGGHPLMASSAHLAAAAAPVINFNISTDDKVDKVEIATASTGMKAATAGGIVKASQQQQQQRFVALFDYEPQRADEMALRRGDSVLLLCRESERWWLGENLTTAGNDRGYFPANYVSPSEDSSARRRGCRTRKLASTARSSQQARQPGAAGDGYGWYTSRDKTTAANSDA